MMERKSKVEILHKEITRLSTKSIQILYEMDGVGNSAYQILKSFNVTDRDELIIVLPNWNDKQLECLAFILHDGNGFGETYTDNFLLGYIFTLSDDSLASDLLNQRLIFFFQENNMESVQLLDSMVNRLHILRLNGYIDEPKYKYWIENIATIKAML